MTAGYQIADEPRPNALTRVAVDPVWPLFGVMFGGAWLAWPWFVLNAYALGSPTREREIAIVVGAFLGVAAIAFGGGVVLSSVPEASQASVAPYVLLALTVWKIGSCYYLYTTQARTFGIFEYYSQTKVMNGLPILVAGFVLATRFEDSVLGEAGLLGLMLG